MAELRHGTRAEGVQYHRECFLHDVPTNSREAMVLLGLCGSIRPPLRRLSLEVRSSRPPVGGLRLKIESTGLPVSDHDVVYDHAKVGVDNTDYKPQET